jgi:hypothetical protein
VIKKTILKYYKVKQKNAYIEVPCDVDHTQKKHTVNRKKVEEIEVVKDWGFRAD